MSAKSTTSLQTNGFFTGFCLSVRFAGVKKSLADFGVTSASGGDSKAADNDDDLDLFGDDDEVCLDIAFRLKCQLSVTD